MPVVVWGRPEAHFCLGQHQSVQAELIAAPQVPVLRRPLGGGGVWLDRSQVCLVLVAPREFFPSHTQDWYALALSPLLRVYREQGWAVELAQQDVWLDGRKLAGSGAASIGRAGLVGSSFLLDFPFAEFVRLIAAPSGGFSDWLQTALRQNMVCWSERSALPNPDWLALVYRRAAVAEFGWRWEQAVLCDDERAAREAAYDDLMPDESGAAKKSVPYGIKVRSGCFLTERCFDAQSVRVLTRDGRIERVALDGVPQLPDGALRECMLQPAAIADGLRDWLADAQANEWAKRILATACFTDH